MSTIARRPHSSASGAAAYLRRFRTIRRRSEELASPLPVEDQVVQSMADVSPTRWHLAHTTWFFETFVLQPFAKKYQPFCEDFGLLFNSYYQGAGPRFERARRGTLGRPTVATILEYRAHVDEALTHLLETTEFRQELSSILEVGLQHEQQHQELILTDIKHVLASNPLHPVYRSDCAPLDDSNTAEAPCRWLTISGGVYQIGYRGSQFCFDNEEPRHNVFVHAFQLASRPVNCGEYIEFIDDGGYQDPRWWLSEGWSWVEQHEISTPLYWSRRDDSWWTMTLGGLRKIDPLEPMVHLSYFEADAYARWAGARLPTEAEWEIASESVSWAGNFADSNRFHPAIDPELSTASTTPRQLFGDVWEWTSSAYGAYPGFKPWNGVLGEYNGKFMCNQFVLRGGSCATPADHIRNTYRNFFPPDARWQFSGLRLAR